MKKLIALLAVIVFASSTAAFAANDGLGLTKKAKKHKHEAKKEVNSAKAQAPGIVKKEADQKGLNQANSVAPVTVPATK